MNNVLQDLKHGARLLLKSPGVAVASIIALSVGIGLTTTMFSIVYGALYRGLPFPDPENIIHLERANARAGIESIGVPIHDFQEWRAQQKSFTDLAAFYTGTVNVSGPERAERYGGGFVTANTFRLLGARPILGRDFNEGEDTPGGEPVIIVGHRVWQERFGGRGDVIGETVRVNGVASTIVGVMPEGFEFPIDQDLWVPLKLDPLALKWGTGVLLDVFGRIRPGVPVDAAALEMNAIAQRIAIGHPKENENFTVIAKPFVDEYIGDDITALLMTMLGAVFLVLLIACTNVANLLLGRAVMRTKEVGIRTALGANRLRVALQFLTESLVICVIGGLLGTGFAALGIQLFNMAIAPTDPPYWIVIKLDFAALVFTLGVTFLATLLAGAIPAIQASRSSITEVLKDESRGASSFRLGRISRALVVFEIALSCGLLVAAGLTIKSIVKLRNLDLGLAMDSVFTSRIGLPETTYPDSAGQVRFFETLLQRLDGAAGAVSVAVTSSVPGLGEGRWRFSIEGVIYPNDHERPTAARAAVSPDYFRTLDIGLVNGRLFNSLDRAGSLPVTVVNRAFEARYFPEGAIGRRFRIGGTDSEEPWLTIVGVVEDAYPGSVDDDTREAFFVPFAQTPSRFMTVIARTTTRPLALTQSVQDAVAAIDSDIPIYFVQSLRGAIHAETWYYRVFGALFMIFGFAALGLAGIGLYAVMAFSVAQRTREVGIRMAIGARAQDVISMILRQGLAQVGVGTFIGIVFAALVSRMLALILFDVNPRDPAIFGLIVTVLAIVALAACVIPARRATRVDPLEALR